MANKPKRTYSWMHPSLKVKSHPIYGRGIFIIEDIKKGTVLIVMGGYICNTEQENALGKFAGEYNMDISEEWSFCPIKKEDIDLMPQHIINHSCEPNSGFKDQCFLVSMRDINKGEEILYDYAFVMWSSDENTYHFSMNCQCGTPSCRKKITENDWKIPALQKKYGDYFQPFLRNKFII